MTKRSTFSSQSILKVDVPRTEWDDKLLPGSLNVWRNTLVGCEMISCVPVVLKDYSILYAPEFDGLTKNLTPLVGH